MSQAVSSTSSSEPGARRRGLLGGAAAALGLAGCGFHPLHSPVETADGGPGVSVDPELAAIRVGIIPERSGQLLRRALQGRLDAGGTATARYDLRVGLLFYGEAVGVRINGVPTRVRYTATCNWFLLTQDVPPEQLAAGTERTLDAYNIPDNEFFASDLSRETMERRLADQLADQLVRRLAIVLRRRAAAAA